MSNHHKLAPWEPSAWMRRVLAEREMAIDAEAARYADPETLVAVAPADPSSGERACDRCGVFVPRTLGNGVLFQVMVTGVTPGGTRAIVTATLCKRCYDAEGIPGDEMND